MRGNFCVNACPMAFDPSSKCKLVVCPTCTQGAEDNEGEDGQANKRGRSSRRATGGAKAASVAKSTGTKKKGECPIHIVADLQDLPPVSDEQYLKRKRKNATERTNENIATHCLLCGIEL